MDTVTQRVALVTGASEGIGFAIAKRLGLDGLRVILTDRPGRSRLATACADLTAQGITASAIEADLADPNQVCDLATAASVTHGRLDVLVNNAAVVDVHRPWTEVDAAAWDRVQEVNVRAGFLLVRELRGTLGVNGSGRIVNISSTAFLTGEADMVDYVASKGGVVGMTRALARAFGPHGVTVNAVAPGAIVTEAELRMFPDRAEVDARVIATQALPRRGLPSDIAAAVGFLVSLEGSFITGQLLNVDGGRVFH